VSHEEHAVGGLSHVLLRGGWVVDAADGRRVE
jgi:hypothetical protein